MNKMSKIKFSIKFVYELFLNSIFCCDIDILNHPKTLFPCLIRNTILFIKSFSTQDYEMGRDY